MNSRAASFLVLAMAWLILPSEANAGDRYAEARHALVRDRIAEAGVTHEGVLDSIRSTLRHEFIPEHLRNKAYLDMALPIGKIANH